MTHNRREFLKRAATLGGAASLGAVAGCIGGNGGNQGATEDDPLTVAVYGGVFKEVMDEHLFKPFREETDVPVESKAEETATTAITKLQSAVQAGKAPVDIAIMAGVGVLQGKNSDLWTKWDESDFENTEYISDNLLHRKDDDLIAIGALSWYINLVNNTEAVPEGPTSWKHLWDSKYEDQMGLLSLASNSFLLEVTSEVYFDGKSTLDSKDGVEKVLEKLQGVKPQAKLWYKNEAEFQQRLKSGEVPAGMLYNDITLVMQDKDAPVESHFVDEGSILDHGSWATLKTSNKQEAARKFIDYASKPEVQDRISKNLYTSPTIKKEHSNLSSDLYDKISGPGPGAAITPKYELYTEEADWVNEKWNEFIIG